jgi:hypothetical protein
VAKLVNGGGLYTFEDRHERSKLGNVDHILQLFDTHTSRADAVSSFLREGLEQCEAVVAVMTPANWEYTSKRLRSRGVRVDDAVAAGQLTILDAAETLKKLSRNGIPDRERFDATIGTLARRLRSGGRTLRAYGEMVDLLAGEGDYRGAQQLEGLWNELREREPFTLFCGYSAVNFGDPRTSTALRHICRSHSRVRSNPLDALGAYLLQSSA